MTKSDKKEVNRVSELNRITITIEGIPGSGKTTIANLISQTLKSFGFGVRIIEESSVPSEKNNLRLQTLRLLGISANRKVTIITKSPLKK